MKSKMTKTLRMIALTFLAFTLLLGACAPAPAAAPTPAPSISLTDGLGRAVTLAQPAQKIISLAPSNTEILFALGAGAQVIARDEFSDYPEEAIALPAVGGNMGKYNLEEITRLQPDLVLLAETNTSDLAAALEKLGLTVYYLSNPKDFDGLWGNLQIVGALTGRSAEAEALITDLRKRVEAVQFKIAPLSSRPTVFYELDGSDPLMPWTVGPNNFMNYMINAAGGFNAASEMEQDWGQFSLEALLVQNPSIILLGDAAYGMTPEMVKQRAGWEGIAAVQQDQIYVFDDDMVSRPGPRLVDGLETLAKLIHPGVFE
jgi:iron complex transport system substrate-binding protein